MELGSKLTKRKKIMIDQVHQYLLANFFLFRLNYINVDNIILQIPPVTLEAFSLQFFPRFTKNCIKMQ